MAVRPAASSATTDSTAFPARERLEAWRSAVDASLIPTEVGSPRPAAFNARLSAMPLGALQIASLAYSSLVSRRSPRMIRRCDPEYYQVGLIRSGRHGIDQDHASAVLRPGNLVVYDSSRPFEAVSTGNVSPSESVVLHLPQRLLPLPARQVHRCCARPIPAAGGIGQLLAQFLGTVADNHDRYTARDAIRLGNIAVDLITAVLAHHLEIDRPPLHSPTHTYYLRIVSYIERHLLRPDLNPAVIAAAHGISLRYLHRIFQQHHHTSVGADIRTRRLERARRELIDPCLGHLSVAAIAARSGFDRPADFTRAFRRHVGMSPRDYRTRA
ncbi:helix-turn-helix domain-containing protein [Virgisporangium aliadipatigenens]|uniref:AraC-like ligand-binding domain-containing protein n=1 Tax=Virgisporangium aliadipatigenens TaxID=741659 RepID=UPI001943AF5C|nr:helix-turn-helix domain-containing protein [Virgisporangium aliadipatigenens]